MIIPFQWGSKRTGPDLARVGGRYSDAWHRDHLMDPRSVVPESNMPSYSWLAKAAVDGEGLAPRMRVMRTLGVPYTEPEIAAAATDVKDKDRVGCTHRLLASVGFCDQEQELSL